MNTVDDLIVRAAKKYGNLPYFEIKRGIRREHYTFRDIATRSAQFATYLKNQGIRKGDRIILWGSNSPEWAICFLGALRCGIVVVPVDARVSQEIAEKYIDATDPKEIFASMTLLSGKQLKHIKITAIETIVDTIEVLDERRREAISAGDLAEILFTSGTTAAPKGVMLTHENLLTSVLAMNERFPSSPRIKFLSVLPLSHVFEQVVGLLFPLLGGASVVYLTRINSITILKGLKQHNITAFLAVPRLLDLLVTAIEDRIKERKLYTTYKLLSAISQVVPFYPFRKLLFLPIHRELGGKLEFFVNGAAPLRTKTGRTLETLGFRVYQGYGATETAALTTINLIGGLKLPSVGNVAPNVTVKLAEDGELLVKGSSVFQGYWHDAEKTKNAFQDGWYKTGDIGKIGRDGYVYLLGREKFRIILSDGNKVYPEDIEVKLNNVEYVSDSCVIGITVNGEQHLHAVLLLKDATKAKHVIDTVNKQLERHQQLTRFSVWEEKDFPRLRTLKVDRTTIEDMIRHQRKPVEKSKRHFLKKEDILVTILARIANKPIQAVTDRANLVSDLGFDSLRRVELLAQIEEELGVAVEEAKITTETTVSDLKHLIKHGSVVTPMTWHSWSTWKPICYLRESIQQLILFRYQGAFVRLSVTGRENLEKAAGPAIYYYNHLGFLDGVVILRLLSRKRRMNTMIVAAALNWKNPFYGFVHEFFVNAFKFENEGYGIRDSLDHIGELVDQGHSIIIAPEGAIPDDAKMLPFKNGIGLLAVELGIDVIGIKIEEDYQRIFPDFADHARDLLPHGAGIIHVKVTTPMRFGKDKSYDEVTATLEKTLREL